MQHLRKAPAPRDPKRFHGSRLTTVTFAVLLLLLCAPLAPSAGWAQPLQKAADAEPAAGTSAEALAGDLPETLTNRDPSAQGYLWISARAAATPDGELRWRLFGDSDRSLLRHEGQSLDRALRRVAGSSLSQTPQPSALQPAAERAPYLDKALCSRSTVLFSHRRDDKPRDTWEDLRRYARAIFSGRVIAIDQGFQGGLPMSLLEVEVDQVVRSSDDYAHTGTFYVAYPYAVFTVGNQVFCRDEPKFEYRPQVGDRVVLFPSHLPRDRHAQMLDLEPSEILAQKPSGSVFLAEVLRSEEALQGLDDLEALLQRLHRVEQDEQDEKGGR